MPAYAVAHMRQVTMGPPIVEYLERIDATLAPFGGRFIVHGGETEVLEGSWPGFVIVIEFPDNGRARAWYRSDAYQEIVRRSFINALRIGRSPAGHVPPRRIDGFHLTGLLQHHTEPDERDFASQYSDANISPGFPRDSGLARPQRGARCPVDGLMQRSGICRQLAGA
jgi:uncharacterized protein (DUF1330 family)